MVEIDKDVRRLLSYRWKDSTAPNLKLLRLRTMVSLGAISSSIDMLSSVLSHSSYLIVLELQDSEITQVPASIGNLFNLRYIGLRCTKVKSLPDSVEKLSNLHTLDIKQTKIEKLPRGITKIEKLRHLLADRYADEKQSEFRYFLGMQAPKDLSNLKELQTLETVEVSKGLAEQLMKLMQLRSVWIDNISSTDCASIFAALSNMPLLSSLLLSAKDKNEPLCFEELKPRSTQLHRLIIRGQWAKGTLDYPIFHSHSKYLKYLALSWCHLGEDPLGMLASHLSNLTYLRLNNMHSAKTLVLDAEAFPHLKTLVLKQMPDVNQIKIMDGALPCIEGLYIVSLLTLNKVPQGIESLSSLKKLWLVNLHKDFKIQWNKNGMHQKMLHVAEVTTTACTSLCNGDERGLSDESSGLDWHTRYQVISGICHGLLYLHDKCSIVHLDLKPENILMDDNMVPKIADFGLSRIFAEQESRIVTRTRVGSLGYVAPEYLNNRLITTKSDIFSFGVLIIELMTGRKHYPQGVDTSFQCFTENVLGSWMKRLETTAPPCKLEIYSEQVKRCIGIGVNCVNLIPEKRPTALDIIRMLNEA